MIKRVQNLELSPVDPSISMPLYYQVYMDLLNLIQSGALKPKDMLPPEMELSNSYNVSRQTMRDALNLLENDGLIQRTAGRGTIILEKKNRIQFFLEKSFIQQMHEKDLTPRTEVLKLSKGVINEKSPLALLKKMNAPAMELYRLRYANDEPIGIQLSTVIIEDCPDICQVDFTTASLYELLLTKYRLPIKHIDQTVGAVLADGRFQSLLKITKAIPLLLVRTTAYLENGNPIEATTSYYLSDRYEFTISHKF
jgi:GntR family transcriptional regulator